jgi:hypothetical protein
MRFALRKSLKGYKPIFCSNERVFLSKGNCIYGSDFELRNPKLICRLPIHTGFLRPTGSRLVERIFRGGISTALLVDDEILFVVTRGIIWRVELETGECFLDFEIPNSRRLLNISIVKSPVDGALFLYFGEYFDNPTMAAVNIWCRSCSNHGVWRIAATFPAGEINHVHNILQDAVSGVVYILTGDFEQGAAIWKSSWDFLEITPLLRGDQAYRAVWMWQVEAGKFIYATDTQLSENHVKVLRISQERCESSDVCLLEGSSIYAGCSDSYVVFSTTVEPGERSGQFWKDLFDRKLGDGIISNFAVVYCADISGNTFEIFRAKKDFLPPRLAQFGTFYIPNGRFPNSKFVAFGNGVSKYDNSCLVFHLVK